jgi:RNA polymerase sigma-70 factor (ECF subfamily)
MPHGCKRDPRAISAAFGETPAAIGFRSRSEIDDTPKLRALTRLAVARAKQGDRDALRFLYVNYSHNVYGYVRSIVRDDHAAEDVTQHVFAKLITCLAKYDDRGVPFAAWLLRLARNSAIDHLRANRAVVAETVREPASGLPLDMDRAVAVQTALRALPPEQKTVVILRHVVGLTPAEIATCMGRSEGSIHGLHHRGRRALQRELTRLESAPCTRHARELAAA